MTRPRNEAAERLRLFVEDELQLQFKSAAGYRGWCEASVRFFDAVLAEERRHVIEQIRERWDAGEAYDLILDDLSTPEPER
jgi:hypothetical protein